MAERKLIDGVTISWAPGVLPEPEPERGWVGFSETGGPVICGIRFVKCDANAPGAVFISPSDFVIVDGKIQKASDPRPKQAKQV